MMNFRIVQQNMTESRNFCVSQADKEEARELRLDRPLSGLDLVVLTLDLKPNTCMIIYLIWESELRDKNGRQPKARHRRPGNRFVDPLRACDAISESASISATRCGNEAGPKP
jgi:hypothetical protein